LSSLFLCPFMANDKLPEFVLFSGLLTLQGSFSAFHSVFLLFGCMKLLNSTGF
jgi:hypothetical protein